VKPKWWQFRKKRLCPETGWTEPHDLRETELPSHYCGSGLGYCHCEAEKCLRCGVIILTECFVPEVR